MALGLVRFYGSVYLGALSIYFAVVRLVNSQAIVADAANAALTEGALNSSAQQAQQRIVGGQAVTDLHFDHFSFQVSLNASNEVTQSGTFCSGIIIGPQTILTAGHCVANATIILLRYGSVLFNSGGQLMSSREYRLHPAYNASSQENDIALIYLPRRITQTWAASSSGYPATTVISLPDPSWASPPLLPHFAPIFPRWGGNSNGWQHHHNTLQLHDLRLTIAGWGQSSLLEGGLSTRLQSISVTAVPIRECQQAYRRNLNPAEGTGKLARLNAPYAERRILCASSPGKSICLGDSGSALFAGYGMNSTVTKTPRRLILLGIASETFSCGLNDVPDIYTRVDGYLQWIYRYMKN